MIEFSIIILQFFTLVLGTHYTLKLLDKLGLFDYSNQMGGDN